VLHLLPLSYLVGRRPGSIPRSCRDVADRSSGFGASLAGAWCLHQHRHDPLLQRRWRSGIHGDVVISNKLLAAQLKHYRETAGITQEELAKTIGVSVRTLARWERLECAPTSRAQIDRVMRLLSDSRKKTKPERGLSKAYIRLRLDDIQKIIDDIRRDL